jgi:hypothetical protein
MNSLRFCCLFLCGLVLSVQPSFAEQIKTSKPLQIRYVHTGTFPDYALKILQLALKKAKKNYQLIEVTSAMSAPRIIKLIEEEDEQGPNIYWAGRSDELEQRLGAIYFPIDRGLIAYRILLIQKQDQTKFNKVVGLPDLRKFSFLQGLAWSDITILRNAGLEVKEGPPQNLHNMLGAHRADAIPRSILDIQRELDYWKKSIPTLSMEKEIALLYKHFMVFFFVSKKNHELNNAINMGLKRAFEDGSFMQVFRNDPDVSRALTLLEKKRKIIRIPALHESKPHTRIDERFIDPRLIKMGW